jgi:DNA replication protein DnaC
MTNSDKCGLCGRPDRDNCISGNLYEIHYPPPPHAPVREFIGQCPNLTEKREREQRAGALARAGIPRLYAGKNFDNYDPTDNQSAWLHASAWAKHCSRWLYLFGPVGVGKTHLSCAALKEAITLGGRRGVYVSVPDLVASAMPAAKPAEDPVALCIRYDLLVIDDLGAERDTPFAREIIYRLINGRYCDDRPTIIASNWSVGDMARQGIDYKRAADRIAEMCGPDRVVRLTGESRR